MRSRARVTACHRARRKGSVAPDDPRAPARLRRIGLAFLEGRLHEIFDPAPRGRHPSASPLRREVLLPRRGDALRGGQGGRRDDRPPLGAGGVQPARRTRAERPDLGSRGTRSYSRRGGTALGALSLLDIQARGPVEAVLLRPERSGRCWSRRSSSATGSCGSLTLRRLGSAGARLRRTGPHRLTADARLRTLQEFLLRSGHPPFGPGPGDRQGCRGARRSPRPRPGRSPARGLPRSLRSSRARVTSPWAGT